MELEVCVATDSGHTEAVDGPGAAIGALDDRGPTAEGGGPPRANAACPGFPSTRACGREVWAHGFCSSCYPRWRREQISTGTWKPQIIRSKGGTAPPADAVAMRYLRAYHRAFGIYPNGHDLLSWCPRNVRQNVAAGLMVMLRSGALRHALIPIQQDHRVSLDLVPYDSDGWLVGRAVEPMVRATVPCQNDHGDGTK